MARPAKLQNRLLHRAALNRFSEWFNAPYMPQDMPMDLTSLSIALIEYFQQHSEEIYAQVYQHWHVEKKWSMKPQYNFDDGFPKFCAIAGNYYLISSYLGGIVRDLSWTEPASKRAELMREALKITRLNPHLVDQPTVCKHAASNRCRTPENERPAFRVNTQTGDFNTYCNACLQFLYESRQGKVYQRDPVKEAARRDQIKENNELARQLAEEEGAKPGTSECREIMSMTPYGAAAVNRIEKAEENVEYFFQHISTVYKERDDRFNNAFEAAKFLVYVARHGQGLAVRPVLISQVQHRINIKTVLHNRPKCFWSGVSLLPYLNAGAKQFTVDRLVFDPFDGDTLPYTDIYQKVVASSLFWNIFFGNGDFDARIELIGKIRFYFERPDEDMISDEDIKLTADRMFKNSGTIRGGRDLCNWTIQDVYEKLDQFNYRCAITGIPLSECTLTIDRVTDEDSLYEPESTIPMIHELNMAKGRMKNIFKNVDRLEEAMGVNDDKLDFTIQHLKNIVRELIEFMEASGGEEELRRKFAGIKSADYNI